MIIMGWYGAQKINELPQWPYRLKTCVIKHFEDISWYKKSLRLEKKWAHLTYVKKKKCFSNVQLIYIDYPFTVVVLIISPILLRFLDKLLQP